jgi:exodeoxyribonuclease V alpha subunit
METKSNRDTALKVFEYAQKHPDSLIVSPQRAGLCGVYELNRLFQSKLNPDGAGVFDACDGEYTVCVGDKVLVTKNQKKLDLVNGHIGHIEKVEDDIVTLVVDEGRRVEMPVTKAEKIVELGYVLTIHKSQGSQAHQVVCPLEAGGSGRMLSRNLIYTAWTRGQNSCVVIGPKKAIRKALGINGTDRDTGLQQMLTEGVQLADPARPQLSNLADAAHVEAEGPAPALDIA